MRTPEIGSLVTGILAVIGLAMALGQYGRLESWARHQAIEAMAWKQGLPYFFAPIPGPNHKTTLNGHGTVRHHRPIPDTHR